MKINALIAAMLATALATSAVAQTTKQTITQLPNCGSEAKNSFEMHKEYPAINEGNGYVGFKTEDVDATGLKERFTLVNCATRTLVQLKAEYLLADSSAGLPRSGDMFSFVDAQHKAKKVANEALFAGIAKQQGYETIVGKLPAPFSKEAARAECGCRTFYPETASMWVK
jgi:hypothetical protein